MTGILKSSLSAMGNAHIRGNYFTGTWASCVGEATVNNMDKYITGAQSEYPCGYTLVLKQTLMQSLGEGNIYVDLHHALLIHYNIGVCAVPPANEYVII